MSALSGTVSEISFDGAEYPQISIPNTDETAYNWNKNSDIIMDNSMEGDIISDSVIESEIMFPSGSKTYLCVLLYRSASEFIELFRIQPGAGVSIMKSGASALGIKEVTSTKKLYDSTDVSNDDFKTIYNRWNKIRAVYSSTSKRVMLYFNDKKVSCKISDTENYSFAGSGAFRFCFYTLYTSSTGTGLYAKNAVSHTAYKYGSTAVERRILSERSGNYGYVYTDGSGDFNYSVSGSGTTHGSAEISGLDPNKCTKEIEKPIIKDYAIPSYVDGYPVKSLGAYAFENMAGLERLDIDLQTCQVRENTFLNSSVDTVVFGGDVTLEADSLSGFECGELVFLGNVTLSANPFGITGCNVKRIFCKSDLKNKLISNYSIKPILFSDVWIDIENSLGYLINGDSAEYILTLYDKNDALVSVSEPIEIISASENDDITVFNVDTSPDNLYTKKIFVWTNLMQAKPLTPSVVIPVHTVG